MKFLFVIPLLFLVACSSPKTGTVSVRPQELAMVPDDAIRYPELTRAYHVGRYADPNDGMVMHEQHIVYRVESMSRWNLRSGPHTSEVSLNTVPAHDPAFVAFPVTDAVLAEVNSQKAATVAIVAQAKQLTGALEQFQAALNQAKSNLRETAALRAAVEHLEKRLLTLEAGQQMSTPTSNTMTNAIPPPEDTLPAH